MSAQDRAQRVAELLIRARRERRQIELDAFGGELPSADDAYRVQDAVATAMGWFADARPTAWKVGGNPGEMPFAAPLPHGGVVGTPARFAADTFHAILIEAEIAFCFGAGVGRGNGWTSWVDELAVTIEVVDTRIADGLRAPPRLKLADVQLHGALVVGTSTPRRALDWSALRAIVRRNGEIAAETRGGHRLGDPSVLLPWFVEHVAARGRALAAGDLVTAGTWAGVVTAAPGDAIDVEFEGVGRASATFG